MELIVLGNRIEALLWFAIAVAILYRSRGSTSPRVHARVAATSFTLFGISDIIESFTGAWWRPWPLLALKITCVLTLLFVYKSYHQSRQANHRET